MQFIQRRYANVCLQSIPDDMSQVAMSPSLEWYRQPPSSRVTRNNVRLNRSKWNFCNSRETWGRDKVQVSKVTSGEWHGPVYRRNSEIIIYRGRVVQSYMAKPWALTVQAASLWLQNWKGHWRGYWNALLQRCTRQCNSKQVISYIPHEKQECVQFGEAAGGCTEHESGGYWTRPFAKHEGSSGLCSILRRRRPWERWRVVGERTAWYIKKTKKIVRMLALRKEMLWMTRAMKGTLTLVCASKNSQLYSRPSHTITKMSAGMSQWRLKKERFYKKKRYAVFSKKGGQWAHLWIWIGLRLSQSDGLRGTTW